MDEYGMGPADAISTRYRNVSASASSALFSLFPNTAWQRATLDRASASASYAIRGLRNALLGGLQVGQQGNVRPGETPSRHCVPATRHRRGDAQEVCAPALPGGQRHRDRLRHDSIL